METTGSNDSPPRFTPKRNENIGLRRNLHKNIHGSIRVPKMETQMSIN